MSQRSRSLMMLMVAGLVVACASGASATIVVETVPVGNPGNAGELSGASAPNGFGPDAIVGGVGYAFNMGKYDVTTAQYTAFLNAVAKTDLYGLYSMYMDTAVYSYGCNIKRSGLSGSYTYTVGNGSPTDVANWGNRPVNIVSWGDAARFANWMHNGQPTGAQSVYATEHGSYSVNGLTGDAELMAVTREADATWVIPTEDEWYKAAYYDPNKPGGAGYWDYPTRSNTRPSNLLSSTGTNNANYYGTGPTIGSPYFRTEVGAFASSPSPYGTFDQGGNVFQWNEANISGFYRGLRGGMFYGDDTFLQAGYRDYYFWPTYKDDFIGFRLANVPEPSSLAMLAFAGVGVFRRRRYGRR